MIRSIDSFIHIIRSPSIDKQLNYDNGKLTDFKGYKYIETRAVININISTNFHFNKCVLYFMLLIGNIELNPGPNSCSKSDQSKVCYGPLRIAHVNTCSFFPKVDLVDLELSDHDIVLVSETHLSEDIENHDIRLKGFQDPLRKDRNRQGGGVAMFVKSNIYCCENQNLILLI